MLRPEHADAYKVRKQLRCAAIFVASAAIALPVAAAAGGAVEAAQPPMSSSAAAVARGSQPITYLIKGKVGRGKRAKVKKRFAKRRAARAKRRAGTVSTFSASRDVVAGTVTAVATFKNRCAPVTMTLTQSATAVAQASGRSPLTASGPVETGRLGIQLASYSCRTRFKIKVTNVASGGTTEPPAGSPSEMPTVDPAGWRTVFGEGFGTDAALGSFLTTYSNFGAYPYPWTDTSRNVRSDPGYYHPEKTLSVSGGVLDAWLHYDAELGRYLVAAPTPKLSKTTYGRFSVRLRAEKIDGYKIAPLLWPDSEKWPTDGEIDFPEGDLDGSPFKAFHHFARSAGGQVSFSAKVDPTQWHVYETLWTPGKVEFLVDGVSIGSSTSYVPSNPMHWVLQMETEISSTAPPKTSAGHVQIDWVKAYAMN